MTAAAAPPAGHAAALLLWQITEKLLLNPVKMLPSSGY